MLIKLFLIQERRQYQKEQAERERLRQESERRREKKDNVIDKQRKPAISPPTRISPTINLSSRTDTVKAESVETSSNSPNHGSGPDKSTADREKERERQRLREQERRRREAVSYILKRANYFFKSLTNLG